VWEYRIALNCQKVRTRSSKALAQAIGLAKAIGAKITVLEIFQHPYCHN
jgi:hypothetical protein